MKKVRILFLASLAACCMQLPALAAQYYDDTASSLTEGRYTDGDEDVNNGPGAQTAPAAEGQTAAASGPVISEITMSETFHEDFQLYEEAINDQYFLYTNVSNGGVTDQPVYVEIPADLVYTMEKDGIPISYASGQKVSARGTYVLRVTAVADKTAPLSEQEEFRAVFRFRIDERPAESVAPAAAGGTGLDGVAGGSGLDGGAGISGLGGGTESPGMGEGESGTGLTEGMEGSGEGESKTDETEASSEYEAGLGQAEDDASQSESKPEEESDQETAAEDEISQVYQSETLLYQVTFPDGITFLSSVPDGMINNQPVKLEIESGDGLKLYRGEEELPYEKEQQLADYGVYRLVSGSSEFGFEISRGYVNRDVFEAPRGTKITEARYEDEVIDNKDGLSVSMEQDGAYSFKLAGDGGESYTVMLDRDTQAPEAQISVGKQQATITYLSNDIVERTLTKAGGTPKQFSGTAVTEPGKYVLHMIDRAGNESSQEFRLGYHMNFYALAAVILAVAGIAAGIVFLLRKKKKLTVR